ncbi:uncharacterized protein AB675_3310 [Cyphellophora attinorum]|uniref:Uncharacterized protein n=1 Tax=Cyphellophora attinorum TaxID=1664694 RepID=A0A0N0NM39_9EURO|nr:uncharacterized protein AB675_3310 [Phialophora attinorum]KPI39759.1 hypothetical protein AB675_3310 [Phialophora attinorum]
MSLSEPRKSCNAAIPPSVIETYHRLRAGVRRQVTWKLLSERIEIWPDREHLMYLSAVLLELPLLRLWKDKKLYCMPCERCGGVVFGNEVVGMCEHCQRAVELRINPLVLGLLSDETAGLRGEHNLLVADEVWEKLFGLGQGTGNDEAISEKWLRERERIVRYQRFTWVLLWVRGWDGGRLVVVDVLDVNGTEL